MKHKKFKKYTKSGLGISKTGKIMIPLVQSPGMYPGLNNYGKPLANVNDVVVITHPGFIGKGSIYRVIGIHSTCDKYDGVDVINLHTKKETIYWRAQCYILSDGEIKDLKEIGVIIND